MGIVERVVEKMSDHPAAHTADENHPRASVSGVQEVNQGDDPNKTETENWIAKGMGGERAGEENNKIRAGSLTNADTAAAVADGRVFPSTDRHQELRDSVGGVGDGRRQ